MSWHEYIAGTTAADIGKAKPTVDLHGKEAGQFKQATKIAAQLIRSGDVGAANGRFNVSLTGHANGKQNPEPGEPEAALTVSVAQDVSS